MKFPERYRQYMYSYPHKTAYRPVPRTLVRAHLAGLGGGRAGLYVHLPFCRAKCGYCNLFSVAEADGGLIDRYLAAISRQLRQTGEAAALDTVAFDSLVLGGGTPALLSVRQLDRLLAELSAATGVTPAAVPSVIELSPSATTPEKATYLGQRGFRRVSIGIQSFSEEELRALGRREDPETARQALNTLRGAFPVLNIDLIYGIPGQTADSFACSLRSALSYGPEELFLYPLYTRRDTPLAHTGTDDRQRAALYEAGRALLLESGYRQVSMRRFLRSAGAASGDCGFEQCLSLGCGGRSYLGSLHVCEPYSVRPERCRASLDRFLQKEDFWAGLYGYLLDGDERKRRYVIKNLLHVRGVDPARYRSHFHSGLWADFPVLAELAEAGMAEEEGGLVRLTETGLSYSDAIGPLFISPEAARRGATYFDTENHF